MTNDYKYAGTPLTSTIAAELTLEFFSGKTVERIEITETVVHVLLSRAVCLPKEKQIKLLKQHYRD